MSENQISGMQEPDNAHNPCDCAALPTLQTILCSILPCTHALLFLPRIQTSPDAVSPNGAASFDVKRNQINYTLLFTYTTVPNTYRP